jgi:AraC family transcriptional regulator of arabinose operon
MCVWRRVDTLESKNMARPQHEVWKERRVNRSRDGTEYYNYPGQLAQKYFYHLLSIGRARLPTGYYSKPTTRAGFLLHYTQRGTVWYAVGRSPKRDSPAGTACLMDFGEPIEFGTSGASPAEIWWVHFDGRDVPHLFTELRADRDAVFDSLDASRFEPQFLELLSLTRLRPLSYDARAFALLAALLAELFAARVDRERLVGFVGSPAVLSDPVRKGIDYMIRFHGHPDLGVKRICAAASLSMRHFMRLFRAEVGVTPIQYLNRYRVERAKQLLQSSDKTVEQIAEMVGTSSQSYFAYLFRRDMGKSPREFRRTRRKEVP